MRFDEDGLFYVYTENSEGQNYRDDDGGCFSEYVYAKFGCESHYLYNSVPGMAWVISGDELSQLIRDYNSRIVMKDTEKEGQYADYHRHRIFVDALEEIDKDLFYLIWEDYS